MFLPIAWLICSLHSVFACNCGNYSLLDKTVIVTGAAQGIGYAIADNFLAEGVKTLIIVDKNGTFGMSAAETLNTKYGCDRAVFYHCHIFRDKYCWDDIISIHEQIDILVNNAGIMDEYDTTEMVETNLAALIDWSFKFRELTRIDCAGAGGTIMNLSSKAGYIISPFFSAYSATKRGIIGFTQDFGHDYNCKRTGVRVVGICPDFTDTQMTRQQMVEDEQVEDFKKLRAVSPLQSADNVGKAVVKVYKTAETGSVWTVSEEKLYESPPSKYYSTEFINSL